MRTSPSDAFLAAARHLWPADRRGRLCWTESGVLLAHLEFESYGENLVGLEILTVVMGFRSLGHGGRLMADVLRLADDHATHLALSVVSMGPMSQHALEAWYARRGFVCDDAIEAGIGRVLMRRAPRVTAPA